MTRSEVKKGPFRANPGSGPYPTEARFYPTLTLKVPGSGPGYRAQMAEDTVTKSRRQYPGYHGPEGSRAIEPRAPFSYGTAPCPLRPVRYRPCHRVPRSNGMSLAGHQGHYYPGTTTTSHPVLYSVPCTVPCSVHCSVFRTLFR